MAKTCVDCCKERHLILRGMHLTLVFPACEASMSADLQPAIPESQVKVGFHKEHAGKDLVGQVPKQALAQRRSRPNKHCAKLQRMVHC